MSRPSSSSIAAVFREKAPYGNTASHAARHATSTSMRSSGKTAQREWRQSPNQSMSQRPHCRKNSVCLPPHPALAYLFLVRFDMPHSEVPEGMVKLAHALVETAHLRSWFYALEKLPKALRNKSFSEMEARMRAAGEDSDLADAVAALSRPKVYETVLEAFRDRGAGPT